MSDKPEPAFRFLGPDEGGPDMWFPDADEITFSTKSKLTDEHLDSLAGTLIPILDEVADMAKDEAKTQIGQHGPGPYTFSHGKSDAGGFTLPEADRLELAIQGQAVMVISTLEQTPDGSSRIVLSPEENWVVKSILMSGLDSSTEIELILVPRI